MRLFAVGLSHRTAPVDLRECVDFARGGLDTALNAVPFVGTAKNVFEVARGRDFFPDRYGPRIPPRRMMP